MTAPNKVHDLPSTPQDDIPTEGWFAEACHRGPRIDFMLARYWEGGLKNIERTSGVELSAESYSSLVGTIELGLTPVKVGEMRDRDFVETYGLSQQHSALVTLDGSTTLVLDEAIVTDTPNDNGAFSMGPILPSKYYSKERLFAPKEGVGELLLRIANTADLSEEASRTFVDAVGMHLIETE